MSGPVKLDAIRRAALDSAEASQRLWRRALTGFAVAEGACWLAYVLLAYFESPTSVLIGVATVLVYSTTFASVMGLRFHLDLCTQRVLKAIESLAPDAAAGLEVRAPGPGSPPPSNPV
jgi:hypothetical protein